MHSTFQSMDDPPETGIMTPFNQPPFSSHNVATVHATSSGGYTRGATGVLSIIGCNDSLISLGAAWNASVPTTPGDTALTVHPYFRGNSFAQHYV